MLVRCSRSKSQMHYFHNCTQVLWSVTRYSLVEFYRCFGGTSCLHHQGRGLSSKRILGHKFTLKMGEAGCSETSVSLYQTIWLPIQEYSIFMLPVVRISNFAAKDKRNLKIRGNWTSACYRCVGVQCNKETSSRSDAFKNPNTLQHPRHSTV